MVGFPFYFHVNAGHPVLKHPLYLKYNTKTFEDIYDNYVKSGELDRDKKSIMATNDNGAIIWYLNWLSTMAR